MNVLPKGREVFLEMTFLRPIAKDTLLSALASMGFEKVELFTLGAHDGFGALPLPFRPPAKPPSSAPVPNAFSNALSRASALRAGVPAASPSVAPSARLPVVKISPSAASSAAAIAHANPPSSSPPPHTHWAPIATPPYWILMPGDAAAPAVAPPPTPPAAKPGLNLNAKMADLFKKVTSSASAAAPAGTPSGPQPSDAPATKAAPSTTAAAPLSPSGGGPSSPSPSGGGGGGDDGSAPAPQDDAAPPAEAPPAEVPPVEAAPLRVFNPLQNAALPVLLSLRDRCRAFWSERPAGRCPYSMTQISGEEDGFVVRFAAVPARDIALTNISDASWSLAWPLAAVSALGSVQIVPRKAKFYRGKRYDARFLSNVSDADVLRQYLKALGFETTKGPFLLRRGIHHPALRGRELTDWMFQGTWKNPNTYMAEGGHGPIAFEEVGEAL